MLSFLQRGAVALHDIYLHVKSPGVGSEMDWRSKLFMYRSNVTVLLFFMAQMQVNLKGFLLYFFYFYVFSAEVGSVGLHALQKTLS